MVTVQVLDRSEAGSGDNWTARLATNRAARHAPRPAVERRDVARAAQDLWTLFDDTTAEANRAAALLGDVEPILVQGKEHERWYRTIGPDGTPRAIGVTISVLTTCDGDFAYARISTSQTRCTIDLVPISRGPRVRWVSPTSGDELSLDVLHDLFLSVFADDPQATARLSRRRRARTVLSQLDRRHRPANEPLRTRAPSNGPPAYPRPTPGRDIGPRPGAGAASAGAAPHTGFRRWGGAKPPGAPEGRSSRGRPGLPLACFFGAVYMIQH